jgi:hypothetical protein
MANNKVREEVLKPMDTTPGGRALHRFTSERLGAEDEAKQNIEKDPVGPVKEAAKTTAAKNLLLSSEGPEYGPYGDRKTSNDIRTPDKSGNYGIRDKAPMDRK